MHSEIETLKTWITESDNIVFFGGAGVSTESGIPDFRSTDGLYHQKFDYPPEYIRDSDGVPRCTCGGRIKPDVVLYEESLDQRVIEGAVRAIADAEVLIVGGTSLTVYPAAGLIRYYRGNKLVLINRDETPYDGYANLIFRDPIGKVLGAV